MFGASAACCGVIPNSTMFRKNCSRFWSWASPPCTAKERKGRPSRSASVGVSVTRGRLPGSITLYGPSSARVTKLCARWLSPIPVRPAITAGTHPPLGVTETTQPASSAAWIEVVPPSLERSSCCPLRSSVSGAGCTVQRASRSANGIRAALEGIGIARLHRGIVPLPVDLREPRLRVVLGQEPANRLLGREVGIAVVEVAVGEGEAHRLVEGVDVGGRVVAHRLEVRLLQEVERLEHRRALLPEGKLVDGDPLVRGADRLLDPHPPARQVLHRDEAAFLPRPAHQLARRCRPGRTGRRRPGSPPCGSSPPSAPPAPRPRASAAWRRGRAAGRSRPARAPPAPRPHAGR